MINNYICLFCYLLKVFARLFPLVGGANSLASPSTLLTGLTLFSEENDFVILTAPNSPTGTEGHPTGFDDEKMSVITEDDETRTPPSFQTRQSSTTTPLGALRTALLNGISVNAKAKGKQPL